MTDRDPDETTPSTHQPSGQEPPPPYGQQPPVYGQDPWSQQGYPQQGYPPQQQPYGYAQPGYPQPGYPAPGPTMHPSANTALVLGIVSLAGGLMLCGLPLVVGPFAWWTGRRAKREIEAAPHQYSGASEAGAGMVLGIVSTVLLGLALLGAVLLVALLLVGATAP
ncbi:MAG: hypothetical protein ABF306_04345 [Nocardioides marinisabuli]|uniref:hypothetical protein n=1 Tax=Nocardioides marinisabuli TaxID=419476 RepID=UPI00321BFC6F